MRTRNISAAFAAHLSRRRISRVLAVVLSVTLLQVTAGIESPMSYAAAGNVGQDTTNGTCSAAVGEQNNVTASFVNNAFCLVKFNSGTTWTVPSGVVAIDMLLVGGGGGGGPDGGGGGGGGQVRSITGVQVTAGNVATVTVGTGGRGGRWLATSYVADPGISSTVSLNATTYTAVGGAGADGATASASPTYAAGGYSRSGGSGGTVLGQTANAANTSKGGRTAIQSTGPSSQDATSVGYDGPTTDFTGSNLTFAGGGGGGIWSSSKTAANFGGALGGSYGGGTGATHTKDVGSNAGQPGIDGTGGGGGGGSASDDGGTNGVNQRTEGGRGGNGVVYIKYVPLIYLASYPQSVTAAIGSTATFTSVPYGTIAATRTKKWQLSTDNGANWSDISGATGSDSYTTPTITRAMHKYQYRYVVTDTYGTAVSSTVSIGATLFVATPQSETDTALTSSSPTSGYTTVAGADEITPSSSDAFTLEAWVYPTNACSVRCTIAAREGAFRLTYLNNKISFVLWNGASAPWQDLSVGFMPLNQWAHVALVRNSTSVKIFINATNVANYTLTYAPNSSLGSNFYVASIDTAGSEPIFGSVDELRVWKSDRSSSIFSDMTSNETSTSTLAAYWNFNEGSGTKAYNQVATASASTDFTLLSTNYWDANVVSSTTTSGPYTIKTFKRTFITSLGGWKIPSGVSRVNAVIVAGGGGGNAETDATGWMSGGGGAGGYIYTTTAVSSGAVQQVVVGQGGRRGREVSAQDVTLERPTNGQNSIFLNSTAIGGGFGGGRSGQTNRSGFQNGNSGGSGGGGGTYSGTGGTGTNGQGNNGGDAFANCCASGGGGGAGGVGGTGTNAKGGSAGDGVLNPLYISTVNQQYLAAGGAGGSYYGTGGDTGSKGGTAFNTHAVANSGSGGGGGGGGATVYAAGNGGSGVVIVRWITAAKPIFTQPTIDTTTAGLTDTITVSADPISPLTRNYVWQFSTDTGTTWANISSGSGFTSQTYTTPILETTTSGIRYQYRVVVTDSDTAGLFIVDTSTAVYITINPRIQISGSYTAQKYGATHTDTFTAVSSTGTGNKIFTVSPNNRSGITWNVATANQATLTIASSVGPGTYYDTMTASDTKGAQTQLSVAIIVSKADTVTVTAISKSDTYTGSVLSFTPTFTVSGLVNSDTITSASMDWNYSGTENSSTAYPLQSSKPINAGIYTITPVPPSSFTDSYTAVSVVTAPLTVYRATRVATETISATTVKYGSTLTLTSSVSPGSGFGNTTYATSTSDSCTVSGSTITAIKSSGTCSFTATISQTANFETATSLAKTATLSKADTITVQVRNPVTLAYSPTGPTSLPTLAISGLVLSDTATTSRLYSAPGSPTTCATGGLCALGDTGPGGGIVFYDAGSKQSWGRYLEAAPANWVGAGQTDSATVNITKWCVASPSIDAVVIGNLPDGIGQGYANTYSASLNCTGGAIFRAKSYQGGGKTDWYLPTGAELAEMATVANRTRIGLVDFYNATTHWGYWGSNENAGGNIGSLVTQAWGIGWTNKNDTSHNYIRPIRAFAPSNGYGYSAVTNSSTVPIDAEVWTVSASPLSFSVGSASNYQDIVYETSTLTITQANQTKLGVNLYGAVAGSSFTLQISGGSGTGALTQAIAAGSTASNCAIANGVLSNSNSATDQKACNIVITKADDRNYKLESLTATVYFMVFINDQPTQVGSGSTIGLSGVTSYTVDTTSPPTITTLSATTISIGAGGTFTINGTGFTGNVVVRFYRNKPVTPSSSSSTALTFNVASIGSAGATTGRITVITDNGQAVSTDTLVINP